MYIPKEVVTETAFVERWRNEKENRVEFGDLDSIVVKVNIISLHKSVHTKSILREDNGPSKDKLH